MATPDRKSSDPVLVAAVATSATQKDAAEKASCSTRTVRRRMSDPAFRREVELRRQEQSDRIVDRFVGKSDAAAEVVLELMDSSKNDNIRLRAASFALGFVGGPSPHPAVRAIDSKRKIEPAELQHWIREIIEIATRYIPLTDYDDFVLALYSLVETRGSRPPR
jgi:hypothetical protein